MKALLVWAYCLGCNSGTMSVTKFDGLAECDAARAALVEHMIAGGGWDERKPFAEGTVLQPQCIPYAAP